MGSATTEWQPLSGMDAQITAFCTVLADLRKTFEPGLTLNMALVLPRAAVTIGVISAYLLYLNYQAFC